MGFALLTLAVRNEGEEIKLNAKINVVPRHKGM
jgi:hypothetical protein